MKKLVIIATLDTKGEEVSYLKELIMRQGHQSFIIDIGCGGEAKLEADITADEVARATGTEIKKLRGPGCTKCLNEPSIGQGNTRAS